MTNPEYSQRDHDTFNKAIRILEVCDALEIDADMARLMMHVNTLTSEGTEGAEVFDDLNLFYQYTGQGVYSIEDLDRKLAALSKEMNSELPADYVSTQVDILFMMFVNQAFKEKVLNLYFDKVLPAYRQKNKLGQN
jgi:hypothetical protein